MTKAGQGWADAINPEDRGYVLHRWHEALRQGTPCEAEFRLLSAGGGWHCPPLLATHLRTPDGLVKKWLATNTALSPPAGYRAARTGRLRYLPADSSAALRRHVVVIAVTGYGQAEDRQRTQEAGFDGHLVKPVDRPANRLAR